MRTIVLLLILCGCSNNQIATDCIPVTRWTTTQQHNVLKIEKTANNPDLDAFLIDYKRMRDAAAQQPCNITYALLPRR